MQVVAEVKKFFSAESLQNHHPPKCPFLSEAPSYGQPAVYFDRTSKGSIAYGTARGRIFIQKPRLTRRKAEKCSLAVRKGGLGKGLDALFIDKYHR